MVGLAIVPTYIQPADPCFEIFIPYTSNLNRPVRLVCACAEVLSLLHGSDGDEKIDSWTLDHLRFQHTLVYYCLLMNELLAQMESELLGVVQGQDSGLGATSESNDVV